MEVKKVTDLLQDGPYEYDKLSEDVLKVILKEWEAAHPTSFMTALIRQNTVDKLTKELERRKK